jgi:hypothetical protein
VESLIAAALGIGGATAAHVEALRLGTTQVRAYVLSLTVGASVTLVSIGMFVYLLERTQIWSALIALALYGSWWFILLNFVQTSESSMRVRLLREFMAAGGALSREALAARYNDELVLRLRLDRMREAGAVVERGGRLFVASGQLRLLARFFRYLKIVMTGRRSEFDNIRVGRADTR